MSDAKPLPVRGIVMRILIDPALGTFLVEYRTRDLDALLSEAEWSWARDKDEAFVFESFTPPNLPRTDAYAWSAEAHAAALKAAGEKHAHAVVFGRACAQERAERRENQTISTLRSVSEAGLRITPADAYDRTRRYLGERD